MADFCNTCIAKWAVNDPSDSRTVEEIYESINPDIDVFDLFERTPANKMTSGIICEGCGLAAVMRTEDNEMKVAYHFQNGDKINWVEYPDLRKK